MANKHNELRLGYVTQLYYDCCDQAVPKQLDLLAEWFPDLLIKEEENPDNRKTEAEYIDTEYMIHAVRYNGSLYAGGSKRISQITGRLTGTAKGNQEKERKTAVLIQKHLARLMVDDMDVLLDLRDNVTGHLDRLTEEQLSSFDESVFDFIMELAEGRAAKSAYEIDSEPFPMDDEAFDMIVYNAGYQLSLGDRLGLINAYLWLLLGGLLRNEAAGPARIFDSSFAPAYRQVSETPDLRSKLHYLFFPEQYESVYHGDDFESRFPDIIWKCDSCGDELNRQEGFDDHLPVWQCRKCGYLNEISADQIYDSDEDYGNGIHTTDEKELKKAVERRKKELGK